MRITLNDFIDSVQTSTGILKTIYLISHLISYFSSSNLYDLVLLDTYFKKEKNNFKTCSLNNTTPIVMSDTHSKSPLGKKTYRRETNQ